MAADLFLTTKLGQCRAASTKQNLSLMQLKCASNKVSFS